MDTLLSGIIIVFLLLMIIKAFIGHKSYKNSIYSAIYSNYLEYFFKYEIKSDCSQSGWLSNQIGTHRMTFSKAYDKQGASLASFVTFITKKGIYSVTFFNPNGSLSGKTDDKNWVVHRIENGETKMFKIANPLPFADEYAKHFESACDNLPVKKIIAIQDDNNFEKLHLDVPVIHYKDIVAYLKEVEPIATLSDEQIIGIANKLKEKK